MSRSHKNLIPSRARRRLGVTLVELLVALVVVAVCSTAVAVLLSGAGRTSAYVNSEAQAMSEVENAYRRMMHNLRTASALSAPTTTTATNTFTVSTQPDPSFGSTAATVTYSISNGNLVEYDSRYNTSGTTTVLVNGISTFSVQRMTTTAPTQVKITITSNTTPAITRTATITCRNI